MRRQIFRQIVSKRRRNTSVFQGVLGQSDKKYASRCAAKATAANSSELPIHIYTITGYAFCIPFCILLCRKGGRFRGRKQALI